MRSRWCSLLPEDHRARHPTGPGRRPCSNGLARRRWPRFRRWWGGFFHRVSDRNLQSQRSCRHPLRPALEARNIRWLRANKPGAFPPKTWISTGRLAQAHGKPPTQRMCEPGQLLWHREVSRDEPEYWTWRERKRVKQRKTQHSRKNVGLTHALVSFHSAQAAFSMFCLPKWPTWFIAALQHRNGAGFST